MIELLKQRLQSKTYITALVLALITALEMNLQFVQQFIPVQFQQYLVFVWPVAMLTLREVTTVALSDK